MLCHISLRTCDDDERLLFTTRLDDGGEGVPLRAALTSEGCTLLRGVELALSAFTRGERAVLRIPPEFAYGARRSGVMKIGVRKLTSALLWLPGHTCCAARKLFPPRGVSARHSVFADVELVDFYTCKARHSRRDWFIVRLTTYVPTNRAGGEHRGHISGRKTHFARGSRAGDPTSAI